MRPQKKQRQITFRPLRMDVDEEFNETMGVRTNIIVTEMQSKRPEFTGVLTPDGEPIFRFFMPKQGMGFLAEGVADYDPDACIYGLAQGMAGPEDDEDQEDAVEETDEED